MCVTFLDQEQNFAGLRVLTSQITSAVDTPPGSNDDASQDSCVLTLVLWQLVGKTFVSRLRLFRL